MEPNKAEVQNVIDRWRVELEIDSNDSETTMAVYGYLPKGVRILFGMVQEERKMRLVDEVIDDYLREADPELAVTLLRDVDTLLGALDEISDYRFGPYDGK